MQVPPSGSAAGAGGIVSQSTSKGTAKTRETPQADTAAELNSELVEHSEAANPDRDAQGQGGSGGEGTHDQDGDSKQAEQDDHRVIPPLPGEEPGELDILG